MSHSVGQGTSPKDASHLSGAEREAFVRSMFNSIAGPYDRLNRYLSLGRDRAWRQRVVVQTGLLPGGFCVDLGTGTGDLALELKSAVGPSGRVLGIDLAESMLAEARRKALALGMEDLELRVGNAAETGVQDSSADAVTMGWVLRNVGERDAVYREILRILKPGARCVCIDMSRPTGWFQRFGFYVYRHALMPILARAAGGAADAYRYLANSTDRFPGMAALAEEFRSAGFVDVQAESLMLGAIAIHSGTRPK